jgi:hypothetical protein
MISKLPTAGAPERVGILNIMKGSMIRQIEKQREKRKDPTYRTQQNDNARKRKANRTPEQIERDRSKEKAYRKSLTSEQKQRENELRKEREAKNPAKYLTKKRNGSFRQIGYLNHDGSQFTHADFERLWSGACNICGEVFPYGPNDTPEYSTHAVDHDHATGKVRGIVCKNCNCGLGYFKDNAEFCLKASIYLRR